MNNSKENDEEVKEVIYIEFTEQNTAPKNDVNANDFRLSDVLEENIEDVTKVNLIENFQFQANQELKKNNQKNLIITVSYLKRRKIKKNYFVVISNTFVIVR